METLSLTRQCGKLVKILMKEDPIYFMIGLLFMVDFPNYSSLGACLYHFGLVIILMSVKDKRSKYMFKIHEFTQSD